jgi:two-component system, OmpR family, manganese sensing sensor histidine kinase
VFQATRRRLALWYTTVTAVLLLLFATGFYFYVRNTLVERVDDTLNHVVEVIERSLVIEPRFKAHPLAPQEYEVNLEASFRDNADTVEDDHIDLEWFSPTGQLLWSTFAIAPNLPVHLNPQGETVHIAPDQVLRQVTQRVQRGRQVLGYLRVSHPWFEVTKPTRRLIVDLSIGTSLVVAGVAAIGWLLSGLAIAPVRDSYYRLRQFTADASHELRNPIAVIQTSVQAALTDPDPQWQQQQLQVVERLTRRLGRLVDDLLFLARQDSNLVPLKRSSLLMDDILADILEEQHMIASEKSLTLVHHRLSSSLDEKLPPGVDDTNLDSYRIMGDRDQLVRLFTNLVSNSISYTPTGGCITVSVTRRSHHSLAGLAVAVTDTGIGIPAEALPHLFDRFYRVDAARTHGSTAGPNDAASAGSGLGLAIAQIIVKQHHGTIRVDSAPGQGTTVTVWFPLTPPLKSDRPLAVPPIPLT